MIINIITSRGGARAVTASDLSLPIIFWTISEIRQNPMRKKKTINKGEGGEGGAWGATFSCVNIWVLLIFVEVGFSNLNVGSFDEGLRATC